MVRSTTAALLVGLFVITGVRAWAGQGPDARDDQAQSEYLIRFADFTEWPLEPGSDAPRQTINFCVLGQYPYGELLDNTILGQHVGERRPIIVRGRHLEDFGKCDVLFISASEEHKEAKILKTLGRADVLTVGVTDDFAARGGIIQFVKEQNRVSFLINVDAAHRARLKIGASLLALAKIVHDGPVKGGG